MSLPGLEHGSLFCLHALTKRFAHPIHIHVVTLRCQNQWMARQDTYCGVCADNIVDFGARAVACSSFDRWSHKSCVGMLTTEYEQLTDTSLSWFCPDCGMRTIPR